MQKIIIKNLGPIQEAEIILKPFVVIIGKSGSGKSIILRTISLLKWLCKHGWIESFHEQALFKTISDEELVEYLKESMLDTYIHKNTKIQLIEDDVPIIEIKNKNNAPTIETSAYPTKNKKLIGKIIFINDIRNFLPELFTLPQQRKIKLSYHTDDMIENFIESVENSNNFQLNTMKNITFKSEIKVGFSKYYLEHNGIKIPFEQSSSGEKSTSILEIICNYFAYSYNIKKTSIKKIAIKNALDKVIMSKNALDKQYSNIEKVVLEQIELLDFIFSKKYQLSLDIFIEEPESNLFPINQKNMAYYLSSLRNATNNPNIMFSTHSPYILTALNNILYASIIKAKLRNDGQNNIYEIINKGNIFNHKDFIAYKLENGKSYSIIDKKTMLIDAEYIDTASSEIMDDFYKIAELDK
ncbi:ATP-binding protein [Campylobacter volucris]|uniref:AAA family ATPase n=1 Tax=Campylobacter volucris TaxID=1031542 RepID=UPI0018A124AC|nr:AAA family ATPase [Campylobacter volucris]MBF7042256.1 ATP-binding protein [Campylobacter volucris]